MKRLLKYVKIVFCNLILIVLLPQFFINSILTNMAYAETIDFPKATKYTSKEEIDAIYAQPENHYVIDKNPNNNPQFNQNAMIGVQGWRKVREFTIANYYAWDPGWDQGLFKDKLRDQLHTEEGIAYVMDGSEKCYLIATGQAFGVVGEKIDFTYKSTSTGQEIVVHTVMSDAKGVDDTQGGGWFPEGPYGYYADLWGLNTLELVAADRVPGDGDFSTWGGHDSGPWLLKQVDNYGGFQGFEPRGTRVSKDIAWPGMGSPSMSDDELDADYVDLDVREFKFSGIPKTVSYEGYTNPIANLFKNLGRLLDLLMGLLINGFKRVIIGWTRIIEIMINYVFFKTEQSMVETPADGEGD